MKKNIDSQFMFKETGTLLFDERFFLVWDRDSEESSFFISPKYKKSNHIKTSIHIYLHSQKCCLDSSGLTGYFLNKFKKIYNKYFTSRRAFRRIYNCIKALEKNKHFWFECTKCSIVHLKKFLKSQLNICKQCKYHFQMTSSERIDFLIDPDTWSPMNEAMVSRDPIKFHSKAERYKYHINYYQRKTGLREAVQTGIGKLSGIPVAIGIMDFKFMGGSMGSAVGEKITRLIEYATQEFLPLIIVSASGGARMQEGSLSLMQMAKISSALHKYHSNKKSFFISIVTSPTTGGVIASFAMLGDIIIAEPNAYMAFAGKRVIQETLKRIFRLGSQETEYLFRKGLFDSIVPRNLLKGFLSEFLHLNISSVSCDDDKLSNSSGSDRVNKNLKKLRLK
uniref:Acetyl-coenzyme A carboxylase carboxyl transferase subunit beta n=1 Tax=Drosera indica TaxID=16680 RepID=A0A411K3A7_9CARY|nr:acetyl-CoA carboxylase carboxyltransferase beta subunit [Drosera indica]